MPERVKLFNSTAEVSHVVGELKGGDQVLVVSKADEQGKNWVEVKLPMVSQAGWIPVICQSGYCQSVAKTRGDSEGHFRSGKRPVKGYA